MKMKNWKAFALALALLAGPAAANERQQLEALRETTLSLIRMMVEQGLIAKDKADELIKQAEAAAARAPAGKPDAQTVRVPYIPESVRQQIKDQLREEVFAAARAERWAEPNALPEWIGRISWEGDIRLRYEHQGLDTANTPATVLAALPSSIGGPVNIVNSQDNRDRFRLRGRIGLNAKISDTLNAGFGLASGTPGSTGNPASTNQTLTDTFNRKQVGIDLAFLNWKPQEWLELAGGRIRNPFFSTDLVWAPDLNFDGGQVSVRPRVNDRLGFFGTLGAFPLEEFDPDRNSQPLRKNKWLHAMQLGVQLNARDESSARFGIALYNYSNIQGILDATGANLTNWTRPQFRQRGNSVAPVNLAGDLGLTSKFRLLNVTGELDIAQWDPVRVTFLYDYVKNLGFDAGDIGRRLQVTGLASRNEAWHARLNIGHRRIEKANDWFAFGAYKSVQRDSVLDAFVEGDFNLGGTNAKGWILGGGWGVARNAWIGVKYTTANRIDGPPLSIDTFQVDLNARF